MPSTNVSLERLKSFVKLEPPTASGVIQVLLSAKLHTRVYNLSGRRDKTKLYRFSFPDAPNEVVLHRREHVGLLAAETRIMRASESAPGVYALEIITPFEAENGFVPARMILERRQFATQEDVEELQDWLMDRPGQIGMRKAHGVFILDLLTPDTQFEFRNRWE